MAKVLRCSEVVPGCSYVARGETHEEVFTRASEHVRLKHNLHGMSPEVIAVIHGVIFDEDEHDPQSNLRDGATGKPWWPAAREWHS
jgi:predicted small metal-binding protein